MAIQKEIWMTTIVEGLFADNSMIQKAFNADEFVENGKTVHIPNAGAASGVVKNRTEFPAAVSSRTDNDLTFSLDEFTTNPIRIPNADTVELSYSKRDSVIRTDRAKLIQDVTEDILYRWSPLAANSIETTGAVVLAHTAGATGNRLAFTKDDVLAASSKFNAKDIPMAGRFMGVDAVMYNQLINSLTAAESIAFHSAVDIKNGVIGQLHTFNIMMRSRVARYTGAGLAKEWTTAGSATDCAAALAWHENSVCRALGEITMFDSESNPLYYGDIYSFLMRAGGRPMRTNVEGLLAIRQATAA
ncbi:MAG: hypothetical protein JXR34_12140 [Bacteroidales bacterium]|nr:hypothetical protein [Bacteroidales bacterium]